MKFFNTAGPVNPEEHYFIPHRFNESEVRQLIEQKKYFILHAPRQSGKTTGMLQFVKQLNEEGKFKALYVNVEPAQTARGNVKDGMEIILETLRGAASSYLDKTDLFLAVIDQEQKKITGMSLHMVLRGWSRVSESPIILFIDEIDSLVGDTLISVLRQIRSGYTNRSETPRGFPQSVCLVGVRDVRDYRIWSEQESNMVLGGSAFNIKAESLTLADFSQEQVRDLYEQHTCETGQKFTDEAIEHAFHLTQGQPWLVNALAYQACFRDVTDRSMPVTKEVIERSKETLILRRDTHLDVLIDRLQEPRVRNIVDAVISGGGESDFKSDDLSYIRDLGLIKRKGFEIANPIYQEVIPRELVYARQESISQQISWYIDKQGNLDMHKLLEAFAQFYRENSDVWLEKFAYKESGPHLLLMAFLQRIINGGGKIHREYALGRGRVDLLIEYQQQRIVLEMKIRRGDKTLTDGLKQIAAYMDTSNASEGHLVIFDRDQSNPWDKRIYQRTEQAGQYTIIVWGM